MTDTERLAKIRKLIERREFVLWTFDARRIYRLTTPNRRSRRGNNR